MRQPYDLDSRFALRRPSAGDCSPRSAKVYDSEGLLLGADKLIGSRDVNVRFWPNPAIHAKRGAASAIPRGYELGRASGWKPRDVAILRSPAVIGALAQADFAHCGAAFFE